MEAYCVEKSSTARKLVGGLPPRLLTAALGALALASCATNERPAPAPPPVGPSNEIADSTPEEPHRIAVLVPLTGSNAPVGISLANAATLALADIGKTGIRITSYDTKALGPGGAAQRALADGAQLILGPLLATDVPAIRSATAVKGVPVLAFSNDSAVAGNNVYVLGFQPQQSVQRVVSYVAARGATRFAGLFPNGVYGQRTSVAFTSAVHARGGQVVAMTNFERRPAALPAAARKVTSYDKRRAAGTQAVPFDALLIADSGQVAGTFMPQLAHFDAPTGSFVLMGTEIWATEPGISRLNALQGSFFATIPAANFHAMTGRYRQRFNGTPSRLASLSYDAVLLAASSAGTNWKAGQPFPKAILADPQGFAGIDGIFRFRGNVAERGFEVDQVTRSGFVTVSPAPRSFTGN